MTDDWFLAQPLRAHMRKRERRQTNWWPVITGMIIALPFGIIAGWLSAVWWG